VDRPRRSASTGDVPAAWTGAIADSVQSLQGCTGLHVIPTMSTETGHKSIVLRLQCSYSIDIYVHILYVIAFVFAFKCINELVLHL